MTEHHISQSNLGDLVSVAPGDVVTLHGTISGLSFNTTGRSGITFRSDPANPALLDGNGAQHAFYGSGAGLVLLDIEIMDYTPGQQRGAIQGADGIRWHVEGCNVHHNGKGGHGYGLRFGPEMTILSSRFNDNGAMGCSGIGNNILMEDVEIARNNWRGDWDDARIEAYLLESALAEPRLPGTYDHSHSPESAFAVDHFWEGGGAKIVRTEGFVARRIHVHHNGGRGWWPDIQNINGYSEDVTAEWNAGEGIANELGGSWTFDWWTSKYNGMGDRRGWLWGAQAIHQNVTDGVLSHGLAIVHALGGNGISHINQGRVPRAARNTIRDTVIVYESSKGRHGWVSDADGNEPPTWERVRVIAPDGGNHISSNGPLLPGGEGPQIAEVGARALPAFSPTQEPPSSGGWMEIRVAEADTLKAQGDAALSAAEVALNDARAAIDGLYTLAITPPPTVDVTTLEEEALIALADSVQAEQAKRLREQS